MDAPGSRILLRPGGLGRGGRLRGGGPGHGRLPGSGPLNDPGARCPSPARDSRSRTPAASGSSWRGFPPLTLCVVTGGQFRRQDDGPRAACTCGRRCQRHGNPEDPGRRHDRAFPRALFRSGVPLSRQCRGLHMQLEQVSVPGPNCGPLA